MSYFVVMYDLIKKDETEYEELWDELERLHAHRFQKSCWFVDLALTEHELKDLLKSHMEDNDRLMVIRFSDAPTWTKAMRGTTAWLDARFP